MGIALTHVNRMEKLQLASNWKVCASHQLGVYVFYTPIERNV